MPFLTESAVRARASRIARSAGRTAGRILLETTASVGQKFDVFLSHSSAEPEEILLGIKSFLEDDGLSVYVDKYSDPQLSLDRVSRETASILRSRMGDSKILLYVHSVHSSKSRWMPWELGYFDGLKGKVGVIPVTKDQEETFKGEEYLNLYPYVEIAEGSLSRLECLWILESAKRYARLDLWADGKDSIRLR